MTLWDLNVLIGKEKETLYAMTANNEAEKAAWTRQHTKIREMYIVFNSYKKGKMSKTEQQNIKISSSIIIK